MLATGDGVVHKRAVGGIRRRGIVKTVCAHTRKVKVVCHDGSTCNWQAMANFQRVSLVPHVSAAWKPPVPSDRRTTALPCASPLSKIVAETTPNAAPKESPQTPARHTSFSERMMMTPATDKTASPNPRASFSKGGLALLSAVSDLQRALM